MLPTIAIDCRFAASPLGLGRYVRELVSRMILSKDATFVLIITGKDHAWLGEGAKQCRLIETSIPHYSLAEQLRLPHLIAAIKPDVLFVPHFNAPVFSSIPTVITVHDLILHHYPNEASFLKQILYRTLIGTAVRRARSIITVSGFVGEELRTQYGERIARKTVVIPEGVSDHYAPRSATESTPVLQRLGIAGSYFLYVGSAKEHKNVPLLIEAFSNANILDTSLVLVTGGREVRALDPLPDDVHLISDVSEEDMPALYSSAQAFVTASLYEGYGLPVAEALACGCPVIASNRSALPEVANGHALLVEPTVEAFAIAFAHPPQLAAPYRAGSWGEVASHTLAVLLQSGVNP